MMAVRSFLCFFLVLSLTWSVSHACRVCIANAAKAISTASLFGSQQAYFMKPQDSKLPEANKLLFSSLPYERQQRVIAQSSLLNMKDAANGHMLPRMFPLKATSDDAKDDDSVSSADEQGDPTADTSQENEPSDAASMAMLASLAFYKRIISPLLPPACRFVPTCSQYGVQAIQELGPTKGVILIAWRLLRCSPIGGKGYDPPR